MVAGDNFNVRCYYGSYLLHFPGVLLYCPKNVTLTLFSLTMYVNFEAFILN